MLGMHFAPHLLAPLTPAFGYVAASLAMSERVEATVSKVRMSCVAVRCLLYDELCDVLYDVMKHPPSPPSPPHTRGTHTQALLTLYMLPTLQIRT
jgi:hypothetical protein